MQQNLQVDKCVKTLLVPLLQKEISEEKASELAETLARIISVVCLIHLEPLHQQIEKLQQRLEELQKDNQYLKEVLGDLGMAAIEDRLGMERCSSQFLAAAEQHFHDLSDFTTTLTPEQCA